jgi:hypothetical protein
VPALNNIARRDKPLDADDIKQLRELGDSDFIIDFVLKIARVRESFVGQYTAPAPQPFFRPFGAPSPSTNPPSAFGTFGSPTKQCFGNHKCELHNTNTQCAAVSSAAHGRESHDFTKAICKVFHCDASGKPLPLNV